MFSVHRKLPLRLISLKMISHNYQEVLEASLLSYLKQNNNIPFVYQQHNAPINLRYSTKEWFAGHNISTLNCPEGFPGGKSLGDPFVSSFCEKQAVYECSTAQRGFF
jgi:hypothetical protein